ncbi:MAG: hypothetical protein JO208_10945 [Alphaproteobacteria bacterium]|nr:hypothetical protein [Alphaproteobacteria bacterium]
MFSIRLGFAAALLLTSAAARADVEINNKPTTNMDCEAGVCTATAKKAVLNVSDLANMLASGDVAVKTGTVAKDIDIDQPLQWTSTSRLTLDAQRSVQIDKQVTVAGQGALTVTTNDSGTPKKNDGEFVIVPERGSVQFWDPSSSLIIDGHTYTLVGDIKTLASAIAANPSGFYALAKPYDASVDGTYSSSPIETTFYGAFEGLGNAVSNLTVHPGRVDAAGLFTAIGGSVRDLGVVNADVGGGQPGEIGILAGVSAGEISRVRTTGVMKFFAAGKQSAGGLVGVNNGVIEDSFADVRLSAEQGAFSSGGGLAGYNGGFVSNSYVRGSAIYRRAYDVNVGGLVGENVGTIQNTYARNSLHDGKQNCCETSFGGLIGENYHQGRVTNSYAAGQIRENNADTTRIGGLMGTDKSHTGKISNTYWDIDMGVSDPKRGAGNRKNDPGITGLTDTQLKSGLPDGFDQKIWCQSANVNDGYPYLCALPPP